MKLDEPALISMAVFKIISTNEELHVQATQLSIKTKKKNTSHCYVKYVSNRSVNLPVYAARNVISDDDHESPG
jgi:hypothetical protein